MRRVYTEELRAGMVVARKVMGAEGRHLITENTELTESYIDKLKQLGIGSIYIKDNLDDIDVPEMVSEKILGIVSANLKNSLHAFSAGKALDMVTLRKSVAMLIDEAVSNRNNLIQTEDIRSYDDYLPFHAINVSVFSVITGLSLGYTESSLVDLGLGALLHDIGMVNIDPSIISNPGALDKHEMDEIKQHPAIGFNILRSYRELSIPAAHIAYQHHERVNGSGYPRGLGNRDIVEYAKIAAVADTFDAIISDHPYRKGYSTSEGLTVLKGLQNSYFAPEIVEAFSANVAVYPVGSLVGLGNGRIGVILAANKFNADRPLVRVICDQKGNTVIPPYELDLQKSRDVKIIKRLSQAESDLIRNKVTDNAFASGQRPIKASS